MRKSAELKTEFRKTSALIPYLNNARTHSKAQVAQIAASIKEFGWTQPVVVDSKDMILAGHGRLLAARELGIEEVPVVCAEGLTEAQKKAYILADNRIAMSSAWDIDLLSTEMSFLDGEGFESSLTGFSQKEIESILAGELIEQDSAPDDSGRIKDYWGIVVACSEEFEANQIMQEFQGRGLSCKRIR